MAPCGVPKKSSPTHHLILNRQKLDDQMHIEPRTSGREGGEPRSCLQPPLCPNGSFEEHPTQSSSHIPVPRNRYRPLSLSSFSLSLSKPLSLSVTQCLTLSCFVFSSICTLFLCLSLLSTSPLLFFLCATCAGPKHRLLSQVGSGTQQQ